MEKQEIKTKSIKVESIDIKVMDNGGQRYSLTDGSNQKFSFFTTKQDKTDTKAYAEWKNMKLGKSSQVQISYVEDHYEYQGKPIMSRKIIGFRELSQVSYEKTPDQEQNDFGRRLAVHGFVNAYLHSHSIEDTIKSLPSLLRLEDEVSAILTQKTPYKSFTEAEGISKIEDYDMPFDESGWDGIEAHKTDN